MSATGAAWVGPDCSPSQEQAGRKQGTGATRACRTPPHPSRRAHARPDLRHLYRTRAPQDEDGRARSELRRVAEPFTVIPSHDVKQPTPTGRPTADHARHGTLFIEDWRLLA